MLRPESCRWGAQSPGSQPRGSWRSCYGGRVPTRGHWPSSQCTLLRPPLISLSFSHAVPPSPPPPNTCVSVALPLTSQPGLPFWALRGVSCGCCGDGVAGWRPQSPAAASSPSSPAPRPVGRRPLCFREPATSFLLDTVPHATPPDPLSGQGPRVCLLSRLHSPRPHASPGRWPPAGRSPPSSQVSRLCFPAFSLRSHPLS